MISTTKKIIGATSGAVLIFLFLSISQVLAYDLGFPHVYMGSGYTGLYAPPIFPGASPSSPLPLVSLTANPIIVSPGYPTALSWSSSNATSCYASGSWSGSKTLSGSEAVYPSFSTSYTITCSNSYGSVSDSETVFINAPFSSQPSGGFNAACAVSPEIASVGQTVIFAAGYAGGTGPYAYSWSGDISGSGETRTVSFSTTGTKTANVTITDVTGKTAQGTCSVSVNPVVVQAAPKPTSKSAPKPVVQLAKTETCNCVPQTVPVQLIQAPACQTFTVCQNSPKGNFIYNADTGTWTFRGEDGNQNGSNGKGRSTLASLILSERGNPTRAGFMLIWYFVLLLAAALGVLIFKFLRRRDVLE